jgi:hypothetical protein
MTGNGVPLEFGTDIVTPTTQRIRTLADIPSIQNLVIPEREYIVPGVIARSTITLWTGDCGSGKSFLLLKMAVAVASGSEFLGRRCKQTPVLYLDFENPPFAVKERMEVMAGSPLADLHIWGTWLEQQPPQAGSELLLTIAKEERPLIVIDPLRYFHGSEENDSTEMAAVMQQLKFCAAAGCAVIISHHPSKAEGSKGRGSSVIRDHADVALTHSQSEESGLISLHFNKNRPGLELKNINIRPNYEEGTFELTDSPEFTRRNDELTKIAAMIASNPGLSQNTLHKQSGMQKARFIRLLKEGKGTLWREEREGISLKYYPLVPCSGNRLEQENMVSTGCSPVLSPLGENREQANPRPSMPSCAMCGSFAIYDGECQTCAGRV